MARVRTRFAPSPTGLLHVGGLRTALYDFLLARKYGGDFILRIEDTDQNRLTPGAIENFIDNLAWAGLTPDEGAGIGGKHGPYVQSECLVRYKEYAEALVQQGNAYYCFCTQERLDHIRELQIAQKLPPAYDRHCRNLSDSQVQSKLNEGIGYVIRMKVPLEGEVTFNDIIRGDVTIAYKVVDDQVLIKSDGFPTYHLAATVDDHYMEISHVIRGEEWLPSAPKHLLLYNYFGWQPPLFAHLPLLLNPDKSKMSKRQGDVAVSDYRDKGYLPEALVNFVAFLGWNPGEGDTREIFSLEELVREFSLEHVGKSGAVFNIEKLQWYNQQYIHHATHERLIGFIRPLLKQKGWDDVSDEYLKGVIDLLKERVTVIPDFLSNGVYFFEAPTSYDEAGKTKNWAEQTPMHMQALAQRFQALVNFDAASIEQALRTYAAEVGVSAGKLIHPVRLALTGITQGPSLFHLIEVLGKKEVLARIRTALKVLGT